VKRQNKDWLEKLLKGLLIMCVVLMWVVIAVGVNAWIQQASIVSKSGIDPTLGGEKEINGISGLEAGTIAETAPIVEAENETLTTEAILQNTRVERNDLFVLAEKYLGTTDVPVRLSAPPVVYENGDIRDFRILNVNSNRYRLAEAVLAYQTDHVHFWIESGIDYNPGDVKRLTDIFEEQIYPRNQGLFGMEYTPGVDNDPHLTILYADDLGSAAGYFSSADSYPAQIENYSNQAEMFYLSAEHVRLSNSYVYGVMAHEFQHMIHWQIDRDEFAWINEGLSELAVDLNGYDLGGFTYLFALNPDLQLNFWPGSDQGSSTPHYGASYLFIKYLHTLYGDSFIKDLVTEQENGFDGIVSVMQKHALIDVGEDFPAEALFQRWSVDNLVLAENTNDVMSDYQWALTGLPFGATEQISCGDEARWNQVHQFGTDYIAIDCAGDFEITLEWEANVPVLPVDPHSGSRYFWSNRGDESVMRLSRTFDLREVEGEVKLSYWTWYDIERDYDYLYVNVSENGVDWENLKPPSCTMANPTGANYGCGYNGKSEGWVREEIDLTRFGGKEITIEFEYVTDAAVNGEGLLLDDIAVDAIGYEEDFEGDAQGWRANGFVLIENSLPQRMGITILDGETFANESQFIQEYPARITIPVRAEADDETAMVVLSGLTRYTRMPAKYRLRVTQIP
jgi:immune inhibitor A